MNDLLGRGRSPANSAIDVEVFNQFFAEKVAKVRFSTADAPAFTRSPHGVSFQQFRSLTVDDVISAVRRLPDKLSAADPIPTSTLKQIVDVIAPFINELFNRLILAGHFPATFKEAFITPIVKKPGLDVTSVSSYRPNSNLSLLSKLLECLIVRQLTEYLSSADLLRCFQSGFWQGHSTETAIHRVLSDILLEVDSVNLATLVLPRHC